MSIVLYLNLLSEERTKIYIGGFGYQYSVGDKKDKGVSSYKTRKATKEGLVKKAEDEAELVTIEKYIDLYCVTDRIPLTYKNIKELNHIYEAIENLIGDEHSITKIITNSNVIARLYRNHKVPIEYIRSNSDEELLRIAELNAKYAYKVKKSGIDYSDRVSRWKPKYEKSDLFINQNLLYFTTDNIDTSKTIYITYKTVKDTDFGQKHNSTIYSLFIPNKRDELIDRITAKRLEISDYNTLSALSLQRLYDVEVQRLLYKDFDSVIEVKSSRSNNPPRYITCLDYITLSWDILPPGLGMRILNIENQLERLMKEWLSWLNTPNNLTCYEITDSINESLSPKDKDVYIKKLNKKLIYGLDLPPRNNLKRLQKLNYRVYIIEQDERFYTGIVTDEGSIFWTAYYSNFS